VVAGLLTAGNWAWLRRMMTFSQARSRGKPQVESMASDLAGRPRLVVEDEVDGDELLQDMLATSGAR